MAGITCRYCTIQFQDDWHHENWCRENIPRRTRIEAYVSAMLSIGHSPERVADLVYQQDGIRVHPVRRSA